MKNHTGWLTTREDLNKHLVDMIQENLNSWRVQPPDVVKKKRHNPFIASGPLPPQEMKRFVQTLEEVFGEHAQTFSENLRGLLEQFWRKASAYAFDVQTVTSGGRGGCGGTITGGAGSGTVSNDMAGSGEGGAGAYSSESQEDPREQEAESFW